MSHVLVVGDLMVDVVVAHQGPIAVGSDTPARVRLAGGGSAANTACWLASLGEAPHLLAACGADHMGDLALADLDAAGVTFVGPVLDDLPTGTCVVLVDAQGERSMLPDRGANDRLPMAAVAGGLELVPGWVHLSGYSILHEGSREAGRAAVTAALAGGAVVSVDAASTAPIEAVGAGAFLRWIDGASLVFANDDELSALGGVDAVLEHADAVAVKHGPAGASWTDGVRTVAAEACTADVVDTTGAGDAFAAGWIAAIRRGATVQEALEGAVRTGATAVTRSGARPVLPT
jgi:sugar/nucleoside kinase (ribokinase family)